MSAASCCPFKPNHLNYNLSFFPASEAKARPAEIETAKAKRALLSLAVSISMPLFLTVNIILLFGSDRKYNALPKPFWFPPIWFIHLASLGSSLLMGLASWLVWAEGGFHAESDALPLYVAHVSLSIVWDPLVLVMGAALPALGFSLVHFGTMFMCYLRFREVNPFAKDLVKPCLAWVAYLTILSLNLIYL